MEKKSDRKATWVLIANSSAAQIYHLDHEQFLKGKIEIKLLDSLEHPESRMKESDLVSDVMGSYRTHNSSGDIVGHGSFSEQTPPKKHEAEVFAETLANNLHKEYTKNNFHRLIIFAPGHFQNLINKHFHKHVNEVISQYFDKDYTKTPILKLKEYLHNHLIEST